MLYTENKPPEEVLESLKGEDNIFLLACNGCVEACQTGGQAGMLAVKDQLEEAGKKVTAAILVDFLCNKMLLWSRLAKEIKTIRESESILILSCGIGVQAVAKVVEKPVHPGLNTVSVGGLQGLWPSDERCEACGDCVLDYTGGICPITACTKSMLNGPCGGPNDGKCEIDAEKDCGWIKIYEHLKEIGRLDNLKKLYKTRNFEKMEPTADLRRNVFYDIEI
ncbi:MAG: hypothetical protein AMJ79_13165 [Phycisphaerae bacterium SM23_30]|nr:MAG: hypothetical protein AMJ79_13165 [Phycisphaerae bacterium SM23_30]